jgi:hypothetical protein
VENVGGWIVGALLFGVACVTAWRFVHAQELEDMLRWGAAYSSQRWSGG